MEEICQTWDMFPGLGYKKLAKHASSGKHRIQQVLQRWRGKQEQGTTQVQPTRLNVIKLITESLINNSTVRERNNWILRDGKNKYRKVIEQTRPYQLWVRDWKELRIPALNITVYIFIILDVYTRKIYGSEVSLYKNTETSIAVSKQALSTAARDELFRPRELIIHQDNGSTYTAEEEQQIWRTYGVKLSYADPGKPTQNGYAEGFMSILSRFWLQWVEYETVEQSRSSILKFIKQYNEHWIHERLDNSSPNMRLENYRKVYLNIQK